MSSAKKKASRKPSVLVSRQFTCTTNAFINNDYDDDQTTSTTATSNKKNNIFSKRISRNDKRGNRHHASSSNSSTTSRKRLVPRKIIWNGHDATPRALVGDGHGAGELESGYNSLLLDDINNYFENNFDCDANDEKGVDVGAAAGAGASAPDENSFSNAVGVPWIPSVMEEFCHSCELGRSLFHS